MRTLIRGGRIITATDDYVADVYIENEMFKAIGQNLPLPAERVIDATGKYVIPCGIIDCFLRSGRPS